MERSFYDEIAWLYRFIDSCVPPGDRDPCAPCKLCCTSAASQGVSALELDYIVEHLAAVGRPAREAEDFKAYVSKTKKEASDDLLHEVCPFHAGASGCNIYPARPLSCRAFGRFINKSLLHIIPESCPLRETIVIYTDETFADLVPFALPFYSLVGRYDRFLKES